MSISDFTFPKEKSLTSTMNVRLFRQYNVYTFRIFLIFAPYFAAGFVQLSFKPTVRLNTRLSAVESGSTL